MKVPFFSFKMAPQELKDEWLQATSNVINEGIFIHGESLDLFENNWARLNETQYATGVGNGFDGLVIALRALGIGVGDKVAVPAHTFFACWLAIHEVGAIPVGIDVNENGLLCLDSLESLNTQIRAVMPVHMHGAMVDMQRLCKWAENNGVSIIEDASQAHMAYSEGKYAGTWGHIGVFSLYPTKNLGALGDAGVILTSDKTLHENIRMQSNYGATRKSKYQHEIFGRNSRLDEIQAALLNVNLLYLRNWNQARARIAGQYIDALSSLGGIHILNTIVSDSIWHHFPILIDRRDILKEYLFENGIATDIHYPVLASLEYEKLTKRSTGTFPTAESISHKILSLPISPWHSEIQIEYTIEKIQYFAKK